MTDTTPPDTSRQTCPRCNSPVGPDKKFCESCGAKMDPALRCPLCGAPADSGKKFCESCGAPLAGSIEEKTPVFPVVISEQVPPSGTGVIPEPPAQGLPLKKNPVSGQPVPAMTLVIIGIGILIVIALGAYLVIPMISGTADGAKSPESIPDSGVPAAPGTPLGSSTSAPVTGTLTPGPTQIPPPNLVVNFQAERDPISGIVTITFNGGAGQNGVREVLTRLTRSDGQVLEKRFIPTRIGTSESLPGTKMTDRIEVIVYYFNGNQYKVLDQTFEYKKR